MGLGNTQSIPDILENGIKKSDTNSNKLCKY